MTAPAQSAAQRHALHAAWKAQPAVVALEAAVRQFVAHSGAEGAAGVTETLRFASAWLREHGNLPDSGILST